MKPTSSKGRSPWKVKRASRQDGGIVIPNGAVLVNQGLGKVKLEEDYIPEQKPQFPASMETENDVNSIATSTVGDAVEEGFTEEFSVTVAKVEPENHMSSPERPEIEENTNCCSSSCREEIESLKCKVDKQNQVIREMKSGLRNAVMSLMTCCNDEEEDDDDSRRHSSSDSQSQGECTVKQISLQVDKQNQVIREMKSGLRNAVMSLMTFCKDEEENYNEGGCHSSSDPQSQGETTRFVGEDSLPLEVPSGSPYVQSGGIRRNSEVEEDRSSEILQFIGDDGTGSVDDPGSRNPNKSPNPSCASLESSFTCGNWQSAEFDNLENEEGVLDNEDNSFVPDQHQDEDDEDDSSKDNAGEGDDNQEDDQGNTEDDFDRNEDNSQDLLSSSHRKEEDDDYNPRGNTLKRRRLPRKTQKTDKIKGSINNSKGKKMLQCSKCNRKFKLEILMRDHQRRAHSKVKSSKSECHLCRKSFSDCRGLRRHVLSVHEGVRYKCEYCPREFTESKGVRYHEDTVHKGISQRQQCKVCGKNYATLFYLKKHMKNVHNKKSGSKASKVIEKKIVRRLRKKK